MKNCPYCAEEIQDAAIRCRYCHADVSATAEPSTVSRVSRAKTLSRVAFYVTLVPVGLIGWGAVAALAYLVIALGANSKLAGTADALVAFGAAIVALLAPLSWFFYKRRPWARHTLMLLSGLILARSATGPDPLSGGEKVALGVTLLVLVTAFLSGPEFAPSGGASEAAGSTAPRLTAVAGRGRTKVWLGVAGALTIAAVVFASRREAAAKATARKEVGESLSELAAAIAQHRDWVECPGYNKVAVERVILTVWASDWSQLSTLPVCEGRADINRRQSDSGNLGPCLLKNGTQDAKAVVGLVELGLQGPAHRTCDELTRLIAGEKDVIMQPILR